MTHVYLVVPSYNTPDFLAECVRSIEAQDYPDMSVVVIDDASPDPRCAEMVRGLDVRDGWTGVVNDERRGATFNIWHAIHGVARPAPEDLIVLADGDDWLSTTDAITRIVAEFEWDPNMWVGYGSYASVPLDPRCEPAAPYPIGVVRDRSFRSHIQLYNHPLAFRAWMLRHVAEADLCDDAGNWVMHAYDTAIMVPLLEIAGPCHRHMGAVTYAYRSNSPVSCNIDNGDEMRRVGAELAARPRLARWYRADGVLSDEDRAVTVERVASRFGVSWVTMFASGFDTMRDTFGTSTVVDGVVTCVADFGAYHDATEATIGTNVRVVHGDDVDWFRRVAHGMSHRAVWFLDGERYGGPASFLDELHVIIARDVGEPVLVDDARLFGVRAGLPTMDAVRAHVATVCDDVGCSYDVDVSRDMIWILPT